MCNLAQFPPHSSDQETEAPRQEGTCRVARLRSDPRSESRPSGASPTASEAVPVPGHGDHTTHGVYKCRFPFPIMNLGSSMTTGWGIFAGAQA